MTTDGAVGKIMLYNDFTVGTLAADTAGEVALGDFRVFGQGIAETDSGALIQNGATGQSGVIRLTTTNEAAHSLAVGTSQSFSPALNGTMVMEARVNAPDLDTKTIFVGFSDDAAATAIAPATGATTTVTLSDSDLCGFLLDAALTSDEEWHTVHNGGTSAGVTDSTALTTGVDAVAGEFDILRVEIDTTGS